MSVRGVIVPAYEVCDVRAVSPGGLIRTWCEVCMSLQGVECRH